MKTQFDQKSRNSAFVSMGSKSQHRSLDVVAKVPTKNIKSHLKMPAVDQHKDIKIKDEDGIRGQNTSPKQTVNTQATAASNLSSGLKDKLRYEWKHIYRRINANDVDEKGTVTFSNFANVLDQSNAFLSREDLKNIKNQYGVARASNSRDNSLDKQSVQYEIKYDDLSLSLMGSAEMHHKQFDVMRKTHQKLNRLK